MVHDTQNGFNANIGFEKHAPSPEILAKSIQIYIFNQNVKNVLPFANISDPNAYFTNMIFVLKPTVGHFLRSGGVFEKTSPCHVARVLK